MTRLILARLVALLTALVASLAMASSLTPAQASSHGANDSCDEESSHAYCANDVGNPTPAGNGNGGGNAYGKPGAGEVGNADDKNPPGQYPDGGDDNNGYECDGNSGIAKTNPAHTGCAESPPPPS